MSDKIKKRVAISVRIAKPVYDAFIDYHKKVNESRLIKMSKVKIIEEALVAYVMEDKE